MRSWTRSELPTIYIGEGENVRKRLNAHSKDKNKDFWNEGIVFTSKTNELNTAQIEYLEARLVELAVKFKRCKLKNRNTPTRQSLSEMDKVEVEGFLEEVLTLLPTLGVLAFQKPKTRAPSSQLFQCKGRGYEATGWETPAGLFVVKKGSLARLKTTETFPDTVLQLRKELVDIEILADTGRVFEFKQDFEFSSPTYAATLVRGMRSNGRTAWKDSNGATLKQVQEEKVG